MMRIKDFDLPGGGRRRVYENLVAVGALKPGEGTNSDRASNQLVQFFLRTFFRRHTAISPTGGRKFLLDGKVGQQTLEGIARFQQFARSSGIPLFPDTRVSVATGINVPGTSVRFTIHALNSFGLTILGQAGMDNLFLNPEIISEAPELASELAREQARVGA
jgi:hypothetical protein